MKSKCRSKYRNLLLCMSNFHACICKCSAYIRAGRRLSSDRRGLGCLLRDAINVDLLENLKMNWC